MRLRAGVFFFAFSSFLFFYEISFDEMKLVALGAGS